MLLCQYQLMRTRVPLYLLKIKDVTTLDKNLFIYLTKKSGHTLQDVADLWGISLPGVYKRLNGVLEVRRDEMASWMQLTGVKDAGPVFFPDFVAEPQQG